MNEGVVLQQSALGLPTLYCDVVSRIVLAVDELSCGRTYFEYGAGHGGFPAALSTLVSADAAP